MLKIDCDELRTEIDALNGYLNSYEEILLNLFNQLKDATINWQDGKSIDFENKIYLEKKESDLFFQSLNEKKDILKFIYDKYSDLGKKITCDLNNKNSVLGAIDNCYNQAKSVINEFNKIDDSFYYDELSRIRNTKQKIVDQKNKLGNVKKDVSSLYSQIEEIEKEVKSKISDLEEIKINSFDYIYN
ncbi:MAG: hypothetical protein VZS44_00195 [Bacilli bacterium]|nr:hypothetical protein [Bacilli bacterium]